MIHTYRSYAKINLFLYVTGKRDNGYHDLCSLMTQIDLHDDIQIDFNTNEIRVICSHPDVPEDDSNLVIKAARLFYDELKKTGRDFHEGLQIKIDKRIPPGGGLGGGSSNAALVLKELNRYHDQAFSTKKLSEMGLVLGADIPFFISGEPAIATGVGEQLELISNLKHYHLVLCDPGISASTANVYKNIDFRLTFDQKENIKSGLNMPLSGQEFDVRESLHNDLEESACRLYPNIKKVKQEMRLLLGKKVYMTGSGSSLFTVFSNPKEAEKGFRVLTEKWTNTQKKAFLCSFIKAEKD